MALQTTTSLLMPAYTGYHFLAEVIGADTTATTFVLDCDNDKNDQDCGLTRDTVIVGPWADKTPAPDAPTTGVWQEAMVIDDEDPFTFYVKCEMSKSYAEACTAISLGGKDKELPNPTETFPQSVVTDSHQFEEISYGRFTWLPVTITKGQKYLATSQEMPAPKALEAEMATISSDMPASSITGDVVILTGKDGNGDLVTLTGLGGKSTGINSDDVVILTGSNGNGDLVTLTGSNSRTTDGAGGDDIVTLTGEARPSDTSDSGAFSLGITKLLAAVTVAAVVVICS
ncbi:hypothetical protein FLONG3_3024 [Fusarium longipes]|uniref:Uncharacterized protein n=1 Tax=Fusarium longipes TaxID=694270 RepID=A0A395T2X5_9HYPO|nr:hypothetical protein FLONG3_3024 [Fusarium longipes]